MGEEDQVELLAEPKEVALELGHPEDQGVREGLVESRQGEQLAKEEEPMRSCSTETEAVDRNFPGGHRTVPVVGEVVVVSLG